MLLYIFKIMNVEITNELQKGKAMGNGKIYWHV